MAKYIDADELLKDALKIGYWDNRDEDVLYDLIDSQNAADVEPVRKWIPCSERLPKYGETVLCLCENGGITVSCITYKGTKPGEAVWFGRHYVKAWMPLSVLPKMNGGSE